MAIHSFELLFDAPRKEPLQRPARAHIMLTQYTKQDDRIIVSAECVTVSEVEEAANRLKKDMDRAVAEAKRKFPHRQGGIA